MGREEEKYGQRGGEIWEYRRRKSVKERRINTVRE